MKPEDIKQKILKHKQEIEDKRKENWLNMKPFQTIEDIPMLPVTNKEDWDNFYVPILIKCGAIPKENLEIGKLYKGTCRNANVAMWIGDKFKYERTKYNFTYNETINHFQDDDGHDLFVPLFKI